MIPERASCVVVGSGPAGCAAARAVSERGHDVILLEKESAAGERNACGGAVIYSLCRELDLPNGVVERDLFATELVTPTGTLSIVKPYPVVGAVRRRVFDASLLAAAAAAGTRVRLGRRVRRLEAAGTRLVVDGPMGPETYEADTVVFADGPNTLAREIGIGVGPEHLSGVAIRANLEAPANRFDRLVFHVYPEELPNAYAWVFPKRDCLNVGVAVFGRTNRQRARRLLFDYIGRQPQLQNCRVMDVLGGSIPLQPAERFSNGQALVAGDAAGLVNPITGGGIPHAYHSGLLAGAHAARFLEGDRGALGEFDAAVRRTPEYLWCAGLSALLRGAFALTEASYVRIFETFFQLCRVLSLHERPSSTAGKAG